jgi:FKBP-type peptidyl-prolyl cis-trans isomerase
MPEEIDMDEPIEDMRLKEDIQIYSRQVGYSIAEDLEMSSDCYDLEAIIQVMRQYMQDDAPIERLNEKDSNEIFKSLQKRLFEYQANKNLERAERYLKEVSQKTSAHTLEDGGVVYEVTRSGNGTKLLSENDTIFVQYSIVNEQGKVFISSQDTNMDEKDPQFACALDDFLPSISRAMIGMVEGENRIIYVHPRLAYGKLGHLPPNSLLIVTMTLVKIVETPTKNLD